MLRPYERKVRKVDSQRFPPSGSGEMLRLLPKIDLDTRNKQSLDRIRAVNHSNLGDINTREMTKKGSAPYVQMVDPAGL